MAENTVEITCIRCGHTWWEDLSRRDEENQDVYKGYRGVSEHKTYRVPCPRCKTNNVVTVGYEEVEGG